MTTAAWTALGITVFGAFCYAAASILQAIAARRSTSTVKTLGHPLYLAGLGCDVVAWVGSIVALRELAVYLVESILAGSLALTVVAARFFLKSRLRRRDVAAVVASITALGVLALSAGPQQNVAASGGLRLGFCAAAVGIALLGWGATKIGSPGLVAAIGGLCLGGAALTGRALPATAMEIVTDPLTAALLLFAATGMMMYAHALQIGQVGPVTAVHWTAEVIAPSAVALLLLGDTVRAGWELPAAVAGLVTVGAAVLLATAPANSDTHQTEAAPQPEVPAAPVPQRRRERVIWWGPPPIWVPRSRATVALAAPPRVRELATAQRELAGSAREPAGSPRELTWSPPAVQPPWAGPQRPDADRDDLPVPVLATRPPWPAPAPPTEPVPLRPWHDL
jgi:hypothetical protein